MHYTPVDRLEQSEGQCHLRAYYHGYGDDIAQCGRLESRVHFEFSLIQRGF